MEGHRCPIRHQLSLKVGVNVKTGQLKAIKAALRLSRRHVQALMSEVGFYFRSLTTAKPNSLGHRCPVIRFNCLAHKGSEVHTSVRYMCFSISPSQAFECCNDQLLDGHPPSPNILVIVMTNLLGNLISPSSRANIYNVGSSSPQSGAFFP